MGDQVAGAAARGPSSRSQKDRLDGASRSAVGAGSATGAPRAGPSGGRRARRRVMSFAASRRFDWNCLCPRRRDANTGTAGLRALKQIPCLYHYPL
jgi:hypothetical protein